MQISQEALDRDYHGCGKAWVAVKDGQVVAIRYMNGNTAQWEMMPDWVRAVLDTANGRDANMLPTSQGSKNLTEIAEAALECDDCPKPLYADRYRPTELLAMARAALSIANSALFMAYRAKCRIELAEIGEVISGMCTATEFVPKPPTP
jgi:hypothetical protein